MWGLLFLRNKQTDRTFFQLQFEEKLDYEENRI